jgi:hypothetical protein
VTDAVQTFRAISWLIVKWLLIAIGSLLVRAGLVVGEPPRVCRRLFRLSHAAIAGWSSAA